MIGASILLTLAVQAAPADDVACAYAGLPQITAPRVYGVFGGADTPTRAIANVKALA